MSINTWANMNFELKLKRKYRKISKKVRCNSQQYFQFQKYNQVTKKNYNFKTIDQNLVVFVSLRIAYVLRALEIRVFQASFEIMKISPSLSHVASY